MKQQVTRFEKSTPRLAAFTLMGIGLLGLGLLQGSPTLGLGLEVAGAWVMLIGFAGATIFFLLMGSAPVPAGVEEIEVEDRVQVQLSDELQADLKSKLDDAISEMNDRNKDVLQNFAEAAEGIIAEVDKLKSQFEGMDVDSIVSGLKSLSEGLDIESTTEAISSMQNGISVLNNSLDDLNNLSTSETEKLENLLTEIRENFDSVNKEVQVALKQFEGFNSEA